MPTVRRPAPRVGGASIRAHDDRDDDRVEPGWARRSRRAWFAIAAASGLAMLVVIFAAVLDPALVAFGTFPGHAGDGRATGSFPPDLAPTVVPTPIGALAPANAALDPIVPGATDPLAGGLPALLAAAWLGGAWLIDREARRALVARGPWGDRPTIAFAAVATFAVMPLVVGGILIAAWGATSAVIGAARSGGPASGWRAAAVMVGSMVAILVLRHPLADAARTVATEARAAVARWVNRRLGRRAPRDAIGGRDPRADRRAAFATDLDRRRGR